MNFKKMDLDTVGKVTEKFSKRVMRYDFLHKLFIGMIFLAGRELAGFIPVVYLRPFLNPLQKWWRKRYRLPRNMEPWYPMI